MLIDALLPLMPATGRVLIVGAAPALVRRLREVNYQGVATDASAATLLSQSLAWKLLFARGVGRSDGTAPTINVFHPGLIRSRLLAERSVPLRLFAAVSNRFASDRCAVVGQLASAETFASISGAMIDNHGTQVPLPPLVTPGHAASVVDATRILSRLLRTDAT